MEEATEQRQTLRSLALRAPSPTTPPQRRSVPERAGIVRDYVLGDARVLTAARPAASGHDGPWAGAVRGGALLEGHGIRLAARLGDAGDTAVILVETATGWQPAAWLPALAEAALLSPAGRRDDLVIRAKSFHARMAPGRASLQLRSRVLDRDGVAWQVATTCRLVQGQPRVELATMIRAAAPRPVLAVRAPLVRLAVEAQLRPPKRSLPRPAAAIVGGATRELLAGVLWDPERAWNGREARPVPDVRFKGDFLDPCFSLVARPARVRMVQGSVWEWRDWSGTSPIRLAATVIVEALTAPVAAPELSLLRYWVRLYGPRALLHLLPVPGS